MNFNLHQWLSVDQDIFGGVLSLSEWKCNLIGILLEISLIFGMVALWSTFHELVESKLRPEPIPAEVPNCFSLGGNCCCGLKDMEICRAKVLMKVDEHKKLLKAQNENTQTSDPDDWCGYP